MDQLVFTEQNQADAAVKQLQANDMDVYAYSVSNAQLFEEVKADPKLSKQLEQLGNNVEGHASVTFYRCSRCGHSLAVHPVHSFPVHSSRTLFLCCVGRRCD